MPDGFVPPDLHPKEAEFTAEHLVFPVRRTTVVSWLVVAVVFVAGTIVVVIAVPSIGAVFVLVALLAGAVVWLVGRTLVALEPALLVDHEGLHADGHLVRWADYTGIRLSPATGVATTLTVGTTSGQELRRPASVFRCRLSRVEQLVGLWIAEHRPPDSPAARDDEGDERSPTAGDRDVVVTDADWEAAEADEAPDDEWQAFADRPDEDPFHR